MRSLGGGGGGSGSKKLGGMRGVVSPRGALPSDRTVRPSPGGRDRAGRVRVASSREGWSHGQGSHGQGSHGQGQQAVWGLGTN